MTNASDKAALRQLALERRSEAAAKSPDGAAQIMRLFFDAFEWGRGDSVAAYWPIRDEADPRPIMEELARRGAEIGLPVIVSEGEPLIFRLWQPADELEPAAFGLSVPAATAGSIRPTKLLVPLLAFDRRGFRLGYGAGYYDRTLRDLRKADAPVTAVGLAYAAQEMEKLPDEPFDEPLDAVVTEEIVIYSQS